MYKEYGFVRIGAIVPKLKVANVEFNVNELIKEIKRANAEGIKIVVTPELSITGYTCGDLFYQDVLIEEAMNGLEKILNETEKLDIIAILGMPFLHEQKLYNVAVVIQNGKVLGIVPKKYIPNCSEKNEGRWFSSGTQIRNKFIEVFNNPIIFDKNIIFRDRKHSEITFAIEISEDLIVPCSPSDNHTLAGANIIFNLSAESELVGKHKNIKDMIKLQSLKTVSAYCYTSSGVNESTTDLVFSGYSVISETGKILTENERFNLDSYIIMADIDVKKIVHERYKTNIFQVEEKFNFYSFIDVDIYDSNKPLKRNYDKYPFVPECEGKIKERCEEILKIQSCGLAKRLMHTNIKKTVIGISGGLDSTLAFLVIVEAYKKLGISNENIIAITMPGFGTTDRTYKNACELVKKYGATLREIDIKDACIQHFKDIGISEENKNIAYENSQARERTQILMDIANLENALVIGTGDLSELALGWCTYNGDHMSMYSVNSSVPKTLIKYLVKWIADISDENKKKIIYDILDTPISPELLPPDENGNIVQKTEDKIGPYVLHDFFLYHCVRNGFTPQKIYMLAQKTFEGEFSNEEIKRWLMIFAKRFFSQQFKRNCIPDGPKVGTVSLSPRGDFQMPSDAEAEIWIRNIEKL